MPSHRQYVNLDPARANELAGLAPERAGRTITVVAKLKRARAGVTVEFELGADPGNVNPVVDKANLTMLEWIWGRPTQIKRRALTNAQGEARVEFTLSAFGGDTFKVRAQAKKPDGRPGQRLATNDYVVWRRFYYQMSRFNAGVVAAGWPNAAAALPAIPTLDMASVVNEYENEARHHNIEMVRQAATQELINRYEVLEQRQDKIASAMQGFDNTREPVVMRMVLVNQLSNSASGAVEFRNVQENVAMTINVGSRLWVDQTMAFKTDWLLGADWCWESLDPSWKPLALQHVTAGGASSITVTLPANMGARMVSNDRNLRVRVRYRYRRGNTNGISWYNTVWIAHAYMGTHAPAAAVVRSAADKKSTTIHEAGHFIGMVPSGQATHYSGHDHVGNHCTTGLTAPQLLQASYAALAGTCVMFGAGHDARQPHFCATCSVSVRARSVRLRTMPTNPAQWSMQEEPDDDDSA